MDMPHTMPTGSAVSMDNVVKLFGTVVANRDASLNVATGEIHALVGENGAGKSTLMRVLAGMYAPDGGRVRVNGRGVTGWATHEAIAAGVGMVHQHFMLVPTLTVAENVSSRRSPSCASSASWQRSAGRVSFCSAQLPCWGHQVPMQCSPCTSFCWLRAACRFPVLSSGWPGLGRVPAGHSGARDSGGSAARPCWRSPACCGPAGCSSRAGRRVDDAVQPTAVRSPRLRVALHAQHARGGGLARSMVAHHCPGLAGFLPRLWSVVATCMSNPRPR